MSALSESLLFTPAQSVGNTATVSVVYPNTSTVVLVYTSQKVKGDGYYGASDGLHTVTYTATPTFAGTMTMQATLASAPIEADWFSVANTAVTYTVPDDRVTTTVDYRNFTGNFVWVRGHVAISQGTVESILFNH